MTEICRTETWVDVYEADSNNGPVYFRDNEGTLIEANKIDRHALLRLCVGEPEPELIAELASEPKTAEKDWETECWMYKVEPVEPLQGFPVADVMLWKEDNLMLDVEAMDHDDGDDHLGDDQQHDAEGADNAVLD